METPAVIWESLPGWCGPAKGATPDQFDADGVHHDVRLLQGAALEMPNGATMIEIGSYAGRSAFVLHEARPDLPLYCYDPYVEGCVEDGMNEIGILDARRIFFDAIARCCIGAHEARHEAIILRVLGSIEGGRLYEGPPVSLLHVDGLHTYDQVKGELAAWLPHLDPQAQVIFDDWLSYNGQIQRAAWEVLRPADGWVCRDEGIGSRGRGYGRFRLERQ